jgi:hypothetical protein
MIKAQQKQTLLIHKLNTLHIKAEEEEEDDEEGRLLSPAQHTNATSETVL